MTSAGRGRGWGKPQDNSLRRPGPPVDKEFEIDEWVKRVQQLDINDDTTIKEKNSPIANFPVATEEDQKRIKNLFTAALDDKTLAAQLVMLFCHPSNDIKRLLPSLQGYYEGRNEKIKESPTQFCNYVFIMGEIYLRRMVTLRVLEQPLAICIRHLLDIAGEYEIETAANQIALNGKRLYRKSLQTPVEGNYYHPILDRRLEGFEELFICAREILATRNLSTRSRTMLLLVIDLHNLNFEPLSDELLKFYTEQLGLDTIVAMKLSTNVTEPKDTAETSNSQGISTQAQSKPKKSPRNAFPTHSNTGHSMNPVPRAIRGSGATENKSHHYKGEKKFPLGKKDTIDNGSNKSWGHDDRFSKDY